MRLPTLEAASIGLMGVTFPCRDGVEQADEFSETV